MSKPTRTAREVVELYNYAAWNEQKIDLLDEIVADEILRHSVNDIVTMTREQAKARITGYWASISHVVFTLPIIVAGDDGEHVAAVYQADITTLDGAVEAIASIEVFRVVDGRITDVWNNTHQPGHWR